MAKKKKEDKNKEQAQEKKKSGKLKLIIILVLILGLLGGGGFFAYKKFFSSKKENTKIEEKTQSQESGKEQKGGKEGEETHPPLKAKLVELPTILVNLADPLGRRYLKISIEIEVKGKNPGAIVEKKMPMIKDALILLLSSKTYDDLASLQKKYELKMEIAQRLNQIFGKPLVTRVFFTEFLVQ